MWAGQQVGLLWSSALQQACCSGLHLTRLTRLPAPQVDPEVVAANPKLSSMSLDKVLLPSATLRPGAAQHCVQKQDHGLDTGLDVHLIPHCKVGNDCLRVPGCQAVA
jgi:hypothetical protein